MKAYMNIVGFGLDPDEAIGDALNRAQGYIAKGWKMDEYDSIPVDANVRNPYSEAVVYGYTARIDVNKEVTDPRIPKEPF